MAKILPVLILATVVAGCAPDTNSPVQPTLTTTVPMAEEVQPPPPPPPPPPPTVNTLASKPTAKVNHADYEQVVLDDFRAGWVVVSDVRRSKTNDGYSRVQVFVKNMTTSSMRVKYRFDWQDANGVQVLDPDHDAWEKRTIDAGDDGVFTSLAPTKKCADFKLRMKCLQ